MAEPVIPFEYYQSMLSITSNNDNDISKQIEEMKLIIDKLPSCNYTLLFYLCNFLRQVINLSNENKMNDINISTCIAPNLIRDQFPFKSINLSDIQLANSSFVLLLNNLDSFQTSSTSASTSNTTTLNNNLSDNNSNSNKRMSLLVTKERHSYNMDIYKSVNRIHTYI